MITGYAIRRTRFEHETFPHLDTLWSTAQWLTMRHSLAENLVLKTMKRAYLEWQDNNNLDCKVQLLRTLTRIFFESDKEKQPRQHNSSLHLNDKSSNSSSVNNKHRYSIMTIKNSLLLLAKTPDAAIKVAITRFQPLARLMIILHYREKCSYNDIAYITDQPKLTVKARLSKLHTIIPGYILESAENITKKSNSYSKVDKSSIKLDRSLENISSKLSPISLRGNIINAASENWENEGGAIVKIK